MHKDSSDGQPVA